MPDQQAGFGAVFQDGSLQAGKCACRTPYPPPRAGRAFDRQRGVGGDQPAELAKVEHQLLGLRDGQDAGNAVGGQALHAVLLGPKEEDIAGEQGHPRNPLSTAEILVFFTSGK